MRFGEAGTGIFDQLRASGLFEGEVAGVGAEDVERAVTTAPQETRARFRGEWIRELHANGTPGLASWTSVEDERNGMLLDLSDPWGREAAWRRSERRADIFQTEITRSRRVEALRLRRLVDIDTCFDP